MQYLDPDTKQAPVTRNVFVSSKHRDLSKHPSPASFTLNLPVIINKAYAVVVRNYKYTPEPFVNDNNNEFHFTAMYNGGETTGKLRIPRGDYNQNIQDLLDALNAELNIYDVHFTINPTTDRVVFTFTTQSSTTAFVITNDKLLKLLGFEIPSLSITSASPTVSASRSYKVANDTDLILRITDVEAILSSDPVCNRATAILVSSRSPEKTVESTPCLLPLLQVQHRIQQLRIEILNSDGDLYDLGDEGASFLIEFHCQQQFSTL